MDGGYVLLDIACAYGQAVHDKQSEKSSQIKPVSVFHPLARASGEKALLHEMHALTALFQPMP
jgi:hypothetical protein